MPIMHNMGPASFGMVGIGWLFQIIVFVLLFLIVYWLLKDSGRNKERPEQILKRRLAAGEITLKEYESLMNEIKK